MAKMRKGSAAAKAWGRKMKALRNKTKSKKSSTKNGVKSKVKKAATKIKKKVAKRKTNKPRNGKNGVKGLKSITGSSTLKKVALGVGGAAIATAVISMIMPNSAIGRYAGPIGGYAMGGIEGVLGAMVLPMVTGRVGGNANVVPALETL
jgi:hypothetical protein